MYNMYVCSVACCDRMCACKKVCHHANTFVIIACMSFYKCPAAISILIKVQFTGETVAKRSDLLYNKSKVQN